MVKALTMDLKGKGTTVNHPSEKSQDRTVYQLGTRGSDLALWQAHTVAGLLQERGIETEITIIKTTDRKSVV